MKDESHSPKNWKKIAEEEFVEPELADEEDEDEEKSKSSKVETTGGVLEHPSYKALEDKLTQAELKAHEQWEKAMRAVAELDNVRRRADRDVENAHKYSLEKFAAALLPVMDSLEQALQSSSDASSQMREGIELTLKLLLDVLVKFGVKQIDPTGQPFDPKLHEAMSTQVSSGVAPNTVLIVYQKGYLLNERLIRPARVIVSQAGA